jgi:hypothetical protein
LSRSYDDLREHPPEIPGLALSIAPLNKLELEAVVDLRLGKSDTFQAADVNENITFAVISFQKTETTASISRDSACCLRG